jgi:hypothetical protein
MRPRPRRRRGRAVWRSALILPLALAAAAVGTSAAATPLVKRPYCRQLAATFHSHRRFVGVNEPEFIVGGETYRYCTAGRWGADSIGWYRTPLAWQSVELRPGELNFSEYDGVVYMLAIHHERLLPILMDPPRWARVKGTRASRGTILPPKRDSAFARFAAAAVRRYGPHGSFWKQYPKVPREAITDWQVWNEPNLPYYWGGRPNAAAYTRLLRATYTAIKRVDPRADVITAGMPYFGPDQSAPSFYEDMLRDDAGRYFNSFAFHAYAPNPGAVLRRMNTLRALVNHFGGRRKDMWITEFGYATQGPSSPYLAKNPADQAKKISQIMGIFIRHRRGLRLRGAMLWSWQDQPRVKGQLDYWGLHCGLYSVKLQPKPALSVFVRAAKRLSR